jgi:formylglycine-generating enzyme required for sulfatase activity
MSWEEAVEFCQRLSRETGRDYRLPTEAEWEYSCRAGTMTPFYFGKTITGKLANYNSGVTYFQERKVKSKGEKTPVGDFSPNSFGLYDMHGNVWEWCLDHWHDNYEGAPTDGSAWLYNRDNASRVLRGGSWDTYPRLCRSAARYDDSPGFRISFGFRVVCEIPRTL